MNALPTLRNYVLNSVARSVAETIVERVATSPEMFRSCLNCRYFDEANQWCTGHMAHPPPRVVVYACAQYADRDDIPF